MTDAQFGEIMGKLEELKKGQVAWLAAAAATKAREAGRPATGGEMVFPPYGRSKGMPVKGASAGDLSFYRSGCERTLADQEKARWHDRERVLLAAIRAEQGETDDAAPPSDADAYADGSLQF